MVRKNLRILSTSTNFSAGRPLLSAYNFSAAVSSTSSTYRLEAMASIKFMAIENQGHFGSPYTSVPGHFGHWTGLLCRIQANGIFLELR